MSKKYVCDICGRVIDDPYEAHMREYFMSYDWILNGCWPVSNKTPKRKVHLCDSCYKKLKED